MKILLDASTPAPLARFLRAHTVSLSKDLRWQSLENGVLLDAAEGSGFDVVVTSDQNLRYQQNFASRKIAVVILSTNHWPSIRPVAPKIASAVDFVQRGQVVRVGVGALYSL